MVKEKELPEEEYDYSEEEDLEEEPQTDWHEEVPKEIKKGPREQQTVWRLMQRIEEVLPRSENVADKAIAWGILHDLRPKLTKLLSKRASEVQEKLLVSMEDDEIGASTGHAAQAIMIIWSKLKLKREPDSLIEDDNVRKSVFEDAAKDLGLETETEIDILESDEEAD
jgi:hypothetical protein